MRLSSGSAVLALALLISTRAAFARRQNASPPAEASGPADGDPAVPESAASPPPTERDTPPETRGSPDDGASAPGPGAAKTAQDWAEERKDVISSKITCVNWTVIVVKEDTPHTGAGGWRASLPLPQTLGPEDLDEEYGRFCNFKESDWKVDSQDQVHSGLQFEFLEGDFDTAEKGASTSLLALWNRGGIGSPATVQSLAQKLDAAGKACAGTKGNARDLNGCVIDRVVDLASYPGNSFAAVATIETSLPSDRIGIAADFQPVNVTTKTHTYLGLPI